MELRRGRGYRWRRTWGGWGEQGERDGERQRPVDRNQDIDAETERDAEIERNEGIGRNEGTEPQRDMQIFLEPRDYQERPQGQRPELAPGQTDTQ